MNVLVDTPIWSAAFRKKGHRRSPEADALAALIQGRRATLIGPIRQEVLSGVRDAAQFEKIRAALDPFKDLPLDSTDFVLAAQYYSTCRAKGIQGSNTDFLLCAVANRLDLSIYTTDRDFTHFAQILPLNLHAA